MNYYKGLLRKRQWNHMPRLCHSEEKLKNKISNSKKPTRISHAKQMENFFNENTSLKELKQYIPGKYLQLKRKPGPENLYLICPKVAKTIVDHLKPALGIKSKQIVCETNAGLGLISTELLEDGIKLVRLYESCPEFRQGLKDFGNVYPGRVELFTKDIFHLHQYSYMDRQDQANRVETLLRSVPKRNWVDEPVMTIVGTMPKLSFLRYLIQSLALQKDIINYGRIQLFVIMKPRDYAVLAAEPKHNLNAYQNWTILYNLIFDYELLEKFPRNVFLPWEPPLSKSLKCYYPAKLDPDKLYLVKINFKKNLPVTNENLLPLFYFVRQFYGKGNNKVIPTVEKWVPGCGLNIILPKHNYEEYFEDLDIFTRFRELTPNQILSIFKEMISTPTYPGSPFTAMIESELLKSETIDSDLSEATPLEKDIEEDIEEKLHI